MNSTVTMRQLSYRIVNLKLNFPDSDTFAQKVAPQGLECIVPVERDRDKPAFEPDLTDIST